MDAFGDFFTLLRDRNPGLRTGHWRPVDVHSGGSCNGLVHHVWIVNIDTGSEKILRSVNYVLYYGIGKG